MERKCSLPRSQGPATTSYPKPDESSPRLYTAFIMLVLIWSICEYVLQVASFIPVFRTKCIYLSHMCYMPCHKIHWHLLRSETVNTNTMKRELGRSCCELSSQTDTLLCTKTSADRLGTISTQPFVVHLKEWNAPYAPAMLTSLWTFSPNGKPDLASSIPVHAPHKKIKRNITSGKTPSDVVMLWTSEPRCQTWMWPFFASFNKLLWNPR